MTEEHGFLGNTQSILVGTLLSLTRYEISDRNMKGGAVWVAIPNSGENPNVIGLELLKIAMPYAMFEQQQQKEQQGEFTLPAEFEVLTEMRMGGGNKPALFVKSLRPVRQTGPKPQTDPKAGTTAQPNKPG